MERLLEVDALRSAAEFASEFAADFAESWLANEQQALLFKVAAAWLLLSLVLINVAWWFYGPTIYDMERAQGSVPDPPIPDGQTTNDWLRAENNERRMHRD
ncbi:T-cell leukemia translocation-altered gene protein [Lethenteron reissneri]|uniref:T-cell leukemia translocation-altered gene protein n=1 Tax=Lethenteron reissneri TaxID=7753 RepID=UPI002AB6FC1C|nr:T-cell leukemia translocation-altered gene protein [Lethenteron reissneri]